MLSIQDLYFKLSPWILLLPTIVVFRLVWRGTTLFIPLIGYLILAIITQALSLILWYNGINNLPLLHGYTVGEFVFLFWFYMTTYRKPAFTIVSGVLLVAGCIFFVIDSFVLESIWSFNTLGRSVESLILIVLGLRLFLKIISEDSEDPNLNGLKYINAGLFIYFSGSIVLFTFSRITTELTVEQALNIWTIHTSLLVLQYILLTIGLLKWKVN